MKCFTTKYFCLSTLYHLENFDLSAHFPLVYAQLKRLAHNQLYRERANHTLHTTDLVHEAYLKLQKQQGQFVNEAQFMALASQAMRRILISYAREKQSQKRGSNPQKITLTKANIAHETTAEEIISLHEALERFATFSERQAKVIEYWFFGGFKHEEIARILDVSLPTVRRDWRLARAWLSRELEREL